MKRSNVMTASALVGALAIFVGGIQPAVAQSPIKQAMGDNFGSLQVILYGLISAKYESVPTHADLISSHAKDLVTMIPESAEAKRDEFLTYASNLDGHAQDLKSISELLMEHDKARGESATDHLREALAGHYGGMVMMCVACHNRFRPLEVE